MVHAARDASLVGLAGDLALRSIPNLTVADLAARVGLPEEQIREISLATGLVLGSPNQPTFTDEDAEIFRRSHRSGAVRRDPAQAPRAHDRRRARTDRGCGRGHVSHDRRGAAARLDRPASSCSPNRICAPSSPSMGCSGCLQGCFALTWRTRSAVSGSRGGQRSIDTVHLTVGFVDLVGFTTLALRMTSRELAEVIDRFEESAHDIVTARDGRLVKLIGDEVMFVVRRRVRGLRHGAGAPGALRGRPERRAARARSPRASCSFAAATTTARS